MRCPCCGAAQLAATRRARRAIRYRNTALTLTPDLPLPSCRLCRYEDLSLATLPSGLLERLYRSSLRERAQIEIKRLRQNISQNKLELLLNLSHGYFCRLGAGDGVPSAPLALLADHPE